jgi:hypothetical protein
MKNRVLEWLLLAAVASLGVAGMTRAQVADRAVITGIVTDPSGAAVAGAKVTAIDEDTGEKTVVGTNAAGNYSTPPLVLGTYTLQVEAPGFKTYSRPGIVLSGGAQYRQDVQLQLGAVSQTVEVTASSQMINTETPTVAHTVGQTYYHDLPAVMGADIRLAEAMLQLQPGYVPVAPNGDAIFRGSQFQSRINGGQSMATENWFDGAAFGYAEGHQQTQESSLPYASVKELTVVENTFSAQYGRTSGGFNIYTVKSGTKEFHGNLYNFLTSNKLDARNFFLPNTLPLTQDNWGLAVGGPVPKVTKWGKTFWFFNLDGLDYHSTVNIGYVNTLPTLPERSGDFSGLLNTNNVVGHDALGRPIYQGEIFNPATTRTINGVPVRDGYGFDPVTGLPTATANMIPAGDPLRSQIAAKLVPLIPPLDRNTPVQNEFGGTSDDNNKINVRTWLLRLDHTFNDKFSMSNTYFQNLRPRIAHCGGPGGCNTLHNGETSPQLNDTYIGQGFYQKITNHFDHLQFNWVIKPNLFNHTTIAYDRWHMQGHSLSGRVGWNSKLGLGILDNNAGPPNISFSGTIPYTSYGTPWLSDGSDISNRYQFLDDLTWISGRHTVKGGIEYRWMGYPQTGWAVNSGGSFNFSQLETGGYDALGNNLSSTGDPFASFLLGQVNGAGFTVFSEYRPTQKYFAPWINDDFKVTPNLTLTLGLRFDWSSGLYEQFGRFSTFSPTVPNPAAGGHLGADVFGGQAPAGNSNWNVGPRFGFAYRLHDRNVIRGGYGIYYAGVPASLFNSYPVDGYLTNPTVPNLTNGQFPAYYWDNGFPKANIVTPPVLNPSVMNGGNPVAVAPDTYLMPRYQNWSLSFQRQLSNNMALDIAYVGNHGTRLIAGSDFAGLAVNANNPQVLSLGPALLQADINSPQAKAAGIAPPYPGFTGDVAQALRPWPQYQHILWRNIPAGTSIYHALQVTFDRRLTHGFQFRAAYTWSKLINDGADAGQAGYGPPIQDPTNFQKELRAVSYDDVPQILSLGWIYQLPFGSGRKFGGATTGAVEKLISNWQFSAIQTYQTGRPLHIFMNNNLGGLLFNSDKRPNKVGPGINTSFHDPNADAYLLKTGWADPGPLAFGNAGNQDPHTRGFPYYNEDLSLFKDTYFGENRYVRLEADAGNLFNRVDFCPPDTNWSDPFFGRTGSQCNISRRIQFGLQIFF